MTNSLLAVCSSRHAKNTKKKNKAEPSPPHPPVPSTPCPSPARSKNALWVYLLLTPGHWSYCIMMSDLSGVVEGLRERCSHGVVLVRLVEQESEVSSETPTFQVARLHPYSARLSVILVVVAEDPLSRS